MGSPSCTTATKAVPTPFIVAVFPDIEITLGAKPAKVRLPVLDVVGVAIRVKVAPGEYSTTIGSMISKVAGAFVIFTVINFETLV